jgi:hypothetical protein
VCVVLPVRSGAGPRAAAADSADIRAPSSSSLRNATQLLTERSICADENDTGTGRDEESPERVIAESAGVAAPFRGTVTFERSE